MKALRNGQGGQLTIEMMLIVILLLGVAVSLSNTARSQGWASSLVGGPWTVVRGMIEDGVWKPASDAKNYHPSLLSRHASDEGNAL